MGITPDDINSIDDIVKLPFTTKHDLRDNYPFGLCAVPMSQIVRIHASSGTTGKNRRLSDIPVRTCLHGRNVYHVLLPLTERAVLIFFRYHTDTDCFTGGLEHMPEPRISVLLLFPMSSGNTEKQITLMHDFGSTVLCCTPSYALYLADAIKDSGLPREEFQLKVGAFGAEPWTENMRHEI